MAVFDPETFPDFGDFDPCGGQTLSQAKFVDEEEWGHTLALRASPQFPLLNALLQGLQLTVHTIAVKIITVHVRKQ